MKEWVLIALLLVSCVTAFDTYLFFTPGCPNCANMIQSLTALDKIHPKMNLHILNLKYIDNMLLFKKISVNYGTRDYAAPVVFVGDSVYIGYNNEIGSDVKKSIEDCSKKGCVDPKEKKYNPEQNKSQVMYFLLLFSGLLVICIAVGFFVKKQWGEMDKEVKKPTTRFME